MTRTGARSWMHDPEIDAWYAQQATERNRTHREVLLHQIQQKLYEEVRVIPIWEQGVLHASGSRVAMPAWAAPVVPLPRSV